MSLAAEVAPLGIGVTIVEPAAFRTNWSGPSMRQSATVIDAVESAEPPLRLLLGRAAYDIATERLDSLRAGFDACKEVTLGADYPAA
ncbi:hypothetical protein [Streptomyces sp. RG80]|uniref:hypothetical protein n=1 Tax=Streptomyces sp. RG80 TaxID=3157340 RepID=UPI00338D6FB4